MAMYRDYKKRDTNIENQINTIERNINIQRRRQKDHERILREMSKTLHGIEPKYYPPHFIPTKDGKELN